MPESARSGRLLASCYKYRRTGFWFRLASAMHHAATHDDEPEGYAIRALGERDGHDFANMCLSCSSFPQFVISVTAKVVYGRNQSL